MDKLRINQLVESIEQDLVPNLILESVDPHDPIEIHQIPQPWEIVGKGNYAAVVYHPQYLDLVVKIYAPGRPGFEEEVEVYNRLGSHPAFSECFYANNGLLVLKRLYGVTLYDCMQRGLRIPKQVIEDIDQALKDAIARGLYPHDVHGKNVMMFEGRGLVVDISDFLHQEKCGKWENLKRAYYWIYRPIISPLGLKISPSLLNAVRKTYRFFTNLKEKFFTKTK
ncbi:serine/threonine protein kinase [Anabaena sp. FACHB-1237]|uniref:serine/threonine protein kinase n=1 Tax=Anabaena sp. FACHB-1237 TaxID=2692769 RepID=UPI0016813325|nr:serine/threonine protein kinase [Anabaena sp. FACHB-1237]MBD2139368.1 serine/threonine protein kinase [Anabaena sp. FACHB-1237]